MTTFSFPYSPSERSALAAQEETRAALWRLQDGLRASGDPQLVHFLDDWLAASREEAERWTALEREKAEHIAGRGRETAALFGGG